MSPPARTQIKAASPEQRGERAGRLARMSDDEQMAALRRREFSLEEWCAFARGFPGRVARLNGEFCFIAVMTPEVAER